MKDRKRAVFKPPPTSEEVIARPVPNPQARLFIRLIAPPSVNSCWRKGRGRSIYLTDEAGDWRDEAATLLLDAAPEDTPEEKPPVVVIDLWLLRKNRRGCDVNNLHKLLCDAVQCAFGWNDKDFLCRDQEVFIFPGMEENYIDLQVRW